MNNEPSEYLVFPKPISYLKETHITPFDWENWMDQIEEQRKRWVQKYGKDYSEIQRHHPLPSLRFILD